MKYLKRTINQYRNRAIVLFIFSPIIFGIFMYFAFKFEDLNSKIMLILLAIGSPILFTFIGFLLLRRHKKLQKEVKEWNNSNKNLHTF